MEQDDTLQFLEDLCKAARNKKLKQILRHIINTSPSIDLSYGDWNDREDFFKTEYKELIKETIQKLETIAEI